MEAMLVTGVQELVSDFHYDSEPYTLTITLEQATSVICAINCPQPSHPPGDSTKSCWRFDPGGGSESKRSFRYGSVGARDRNERFVEIVTIVTMEIFSSGDGLVTLLTLHSLVAQNLPPLPPLLQIYFIGLESGPTPQT
jgi:hypothetical protein